MTHSGFCCFWRTFGHTEQSAYPNVPTIIKVLCSTLWPEQTSAPNITQIISRRIQYITVYILKENGGKWRNAWKKHPDLHNLCLIWSLIVSVRGLHRCWLARPLSAWPVVCRVP